MKRLAHIVFVLCSCATACNQEDTIPPEEWPRTFEARVSGAAWSRCTKTPLTGERVVGNVQCDATAPVDEERCSTGDDLTRDVAVRMLMTQPHCIDDAVSSLESIVLAEPGARSDLAAAYYIRAQRRDRPSDLFRACEAATRAVEHKPTAEALFNLALAQMAIGLDEAALATLKTIPADDDPHWRREVTERARELAHVISDPRKRSEENQRRLDDALRRGDEAEVARLVQPLPKTAWRNFEAMFGKRPAHEIALFARVLSRRLNDDPYPIDVANGKAPSLEAQRVRASKLSLDGKHQQALAILDEIVATAERRNYRYMGAQTRATRGYVLWAKGDYLDSLAAYESVLPFFTQLHDRESLGDSHATRAGTLRDMGVFDAAARDALRALALARSIDDVRVRHKIRGEAAALAHDLELWSTALSIQDLNVAETAARLHNASPKERETAAINLAIAHRHRAEYELSANDLTAAEEDLAAAARVNLPEKDAEDHARATRALEFRLAEIRGRNLLRRDPKAAAAEFTQALDTLRRGEYPTLRAQLLVQRAEASQGYDPVAAERDLIEAITVLREEEISNLSQRRSGEREELWSAYFSRPAEAYDRLIALLMDGKRAAEAFQYAERSRAFELIDLVRKLPFAPREFLDLTPDGEPVALDRLRQQLPEGTFLLQYRVTENRVFAWIVSRHAFEALALNAPRADVERRSADLQNAGKTNDEAAFVAASRAVYIQLLKAPFARIRALNGGKPPARLVIVPDEAMHGLSFAALQNPDDESYLVEWMPIEVAPSATLYVFSLLRHAELSSNSHSVLLVGDPAFEKTPLAYGLSDLLPGALSEVEDIAKMYSPATKLLHGDATIPAFLRLARNADVIHFAGHSVVNADKPWSSILLFARTGNDHGLLAAEDLVGRQWPRTRLVVLASCSSAGGAPVGAEGVAPFVRPLIATGVPAVLGTLWNVSDTTIPQLFVSFHQDFRQSGDAAAALRNAQLAQIRSGGLKSIKLWAPFQVVGH